MADAHLGDIAGDLGDEHEPKPEEAFGSSASAAEVLSPDQDPRAGDRLLALLDIAERFALQRAGVPAPSPLWDPDERMVLELLAPSAALAFGGVEPPPPKLAAAILFACVALHAGLVVSTHRRTESADRARKNPRRAWDGRDWGSARDAAKEAERGAGGAVGFPPPFKNGASS